MKKILSVLLALLSLASLNLTVFADMGAPMFDDWYVTCGPEGYSFEDETVDENGEYMLVDSYVEPGTRLKVYYYIPDESEYTLMISDDRYNNKYGKGIVIVSESDFNKYFSGSEKVVSKSFGNDLGKEEKCVVTGDGGVHLRQGPGKSFSSYGLVPKGTTLTYRYVSEYGSDDLKWGYVKYKNKEGWLCINYTEKVSDTAAPVKQTEKTTDAVTTTEAATTVKSEETSTALSQTTEVETTTQNVINETTGLFSSTKNVILACCLGAVILALSATVILLIVKQRKTQ